MAAGYMVSGLQDGVLAAVPASAEAAPVPEATPRQQVHSSSAAAESMAPQTPDVLIEQVCLTSGREFCSFPLHAVTSWAPVLLQHPAGDANMHMLCFTMKMGGNVHSCVHAECRSSTQVCETRIPPPSLPVWMMRQLLDH